MFLLVFVLLIALWCAGGAWLGGHPRVVRLVERAGHWLVPTIFIGIGVLILVSSGVLGRLVDLPAEDGPVGRPQDATAEPGRAGQASSTSSSRSSLQASSSPSGSRIARSGLSASTAPGSWVTRTIAPG